MQPTIIKPIDITRESFRIIQHEMKPHTFSPEQHAVVMRIIHATADFDFQDIIRFHPDALGEGIAAFRRNAPITVDVRMVAVGVSRSILATLGDSLICEIGNPDVATMAKDLGITRSAAAMRYSTEYLNGGIVAIGNAPTALFEVLRLIEEEGIRPALLIGVPVGFVNTVESKAALLQVDVPYITTVGRKGGSTVAVAILNALLRLAVGKEQYE